jgi:hypothetical protein
MLGRSHLHLCVGIPADDQFASEESPSGMLARSGSYAVKSRLIDDDKQVWLDFEWGELLLSPIWMNQANNQDSSLPRSGKCIALA